MSKNSTYYNRKAQGLCPFCGNPATKGPRGGFSHCDDCRKKHAEASLARYHQRQEQGICRWCPNPIGTSGVCLGQYCEECGAKDAAKHAKKRVGYGKKRHREFREKALAMYGGKCADCGKEPPERLELHHIDETGRLERSSPAGKNAGGHVLYNRLHMEGYDPNLTLLCVSCHQVRHRAAIQSNNTSGFVGVHRNKGKWEARVQIAKKIHFVGRYETPEEAADARRRFLADLP